jgi:acyl-CoA synthetase (AMP-forming)/AMP-acid ligase II
MVEFLKAQRLMLQKIPERLELVDAIPRNPSGKILKRELRERYSKP